MDFSFYCLNCGLTYKDNFTGYICTCGGLLDINFSSLFPIKKIKNRKQGLWKYREAIPIEYEKNIVSFNEGFTPLEKTTIYNNQVYLKHDYLFPSGSYKDRGSTVLLSRVKEIGIEEIIEDSSGNAGASIASYSAKAGIKCKIFIPEDTSKSKIIQIKASGAEIRLVQGNRESTASETLKAVKKTYYASHVYNPFFFQGTKTVAFEICEQLGWNSPKRIILPAGNGTLVIGVYKGFHDLLIAGIIDNMPQIIAVQAENCAPLVNPGVYKDTIAEGIAIPNPARINQISECIKLSCGQIVLVSEQEIKEALIYSFKLGYFIEPTSATVFAALKKFNQESNDRGITVIILTGGGLKTTEKILKLISAGL